MSAEVLRRAAAEMRAKAEAYTDYIPIPTRVDIDHDGTCDACAETKHLVASYPSPDNEPWLCAECATAADFEAAWHPAVALAVADWLDDIARWIDFGDSGGARNVEHAVAVARAFLGDTDV